MVYINRINDYLGIFNNYLPNFSYYLQKLIIIFLQKTKFTPLRYDLVVTRQKDNNYLLKLIIIFLLPVTVFYDQNSIFPYITWRNFLSW